MSGSRAGRLRVGVIGLGRLWEVRHKPALLGMEDRFQITALYDQVWRRSELEAAQLGCAAAAGVNDLINRSDVDAIYLLTPQWFGAYPMGLACAAGKPIYCALPLAGSVDELEALARLVEASGVKFMPEFARRFYPATLRLRELIATTLGKPRLIVGHTRHFGFDRRVDPGPSTQLSPAPLLIDPGSYLLDWCQFLFQEEPARLRGCRGLILPGRENEADTASASRSPSGADFESFFADFPGGGVAQISFGRYHRSAWGDATQFLPTPGFQVYAERGAAWLELPERIQWWDSKGLHEETLPLAPTIGEVLNDQFSRLVQGENSLAPSMGDALKIARQVKILEHGDGSTRAMDLSASPSTPST